MSKPLAFLPEVPEEIEHARDWYAERNPEAAIRFVEALEQTLKSIERSPQQGGHFDDRHLYRYRKLAKFPYLVVYREYDNRTLVVAVYHTSRHPDFWKRRTK